MELRHEWKIPLSPGDLPILRQRLRAVLQPDAHAVCGKYFIRSLYFDTPDDRALRDKLDGVDHREKFRIRYYNLDPSLLHLEKKSKHNGLCSKETALLSASEAQAIVEGDWQWLQQADRPLLQQLYTQMRHQGLRPKTLVDYDREPFVYGPGNVRVTLDSNLRTGLAGTDLLNPACVTLPVAAAPSLLEVKWDAFLPDLIRDLIWLEGRQSTAFSKYAICRMYD